VKLNNFYKRAGTAFFIAASQITVAFIGKEAVFVFYAMVAALTLWEFYSLNSLHHVLSNKIAGVTAGLIIYASVFLMYNNYVETRFSILLLLVPIVFLLLEMYGNRPKPITNAGFTIFGIIYIILPFSTLILLTFPPATNHVYSSGILIGFLALQWVNDTGAYIVGSRIGKRKLFERISPKKTWEGFWGGLVTSVTFAVGFAYFIPEISLVSWIVISLLIAVFGTLGDLVESLYKRNLGVKDSGNLLPGHGGFLDRFDSLLFSAPFVFIYLYLFN